MIFNRLRGMCLLHYYTVWKDVGEDKVFPFSVTKIKYNQMRFCLNCRKVELFYLDKINYE